ncbi:MAG TPA: hypothetical protein DD437_11650, partial [Rhodobiaceae bacterium]|nr:hypothetical protein [Rhodobiaceae bacterium]
MNSSVNTPSEDEALYLNAKEAAAELGVSLPTLYAYVSRDLIRSEPVPNSRARRYRAEDVRGLKDRRTSKLDEARVPPGDAGYTLISGQPL